MKSFLSGPYRIPVPCATHDPEEDRCKYDIERNHAGVRYTIGEGHVLVVVRSIQVPGRDDEPLQEYHEDGEKEITEADPGKTGGWTCRAVHEPGSDEHGHGYDKKICPDDQVFRRCAHHEEISRQHNQGRKDEVQGMVREASDKSGDETQDEQVDDNDDEEEEQETDDEEQ